MVESDHIFDWAAQIGFPFRCEEYAAGTNILCLASNSNAFRTTARD